LKFNGTGTRGFSIKLEIHGKHEISLCTIYRNKTIDFSLKRWEYMNRNLPNLMSMVESVGIIDKDQINLKNIVRIFAAR